MLKPLRTGVLFGLGFTLIFGSLIGALGIILEIAERNRVAEAKSILAVWAEPTVLRAHPTLRNGEIVILVSVKNETEQPAFFKAEGIIYGSDGNYYDTCPAEGPFYLSAGEEQHFKAVCPSYGVDQSRTMETLGNVEIQFVRDR